MNPCTGSEHSQCWASRYEELREEAERGVIVFDCRGASVLIRQGIAAWMRAWREPVSQSTAMKSESLPAIPAGCWQTEATLLLANMALNHLRAAHP